MSILGSIDSCLQSYHDFETERSQCLELSNLLRTTSKKVISFILKKDKKQSKIFLQEAKKTFEKLQEHTENNPFLHSVGGIHCGIEEYVEAHLLWDYFNTNSLSSQNDLQVGHTDFLGGLCDFTGELIRYARRNPKHILEILKDVQEIHEACSELLITRNGLLRKKTEDLERNVKKLEEMLFSFQLKCQK